VSRTRWWFNSAAPAGQDPYALLPLLAVDYQAAPLGGRNGAVAGRPVTIDLRVARQEGAPASEVVATQLWSSTDDGATWRKVGLKRIGAGHYRGVLQGSSLRSGTFVSLRTWARDATTAASTRPWSGRSRCADQRSTRSRPAVAAPAWRASRPKASTGPRAPVASRPWPAARRAPQASSLAVRV
jgi:hypothetical protein